jgi:hypothetical protein
MAEICSHAASGTSDQNGNMRTPPGMSQVLNRLAVSSIGARRFASDSFRAGQVQELMAPGTENVGHRGRLSSTGRRNGALFQQTSAVSIAQAGCRMRTECVRPEALTACPTLFRWFERAVGSIRAGPLFARIATMR